MNIRFYMVLVEGFTLVQNPDFQAWFRGSKVVDAEGNPLPCYHGTSGDHRNYKPLTHFGTLAAAQDRMGTSWDKELISPAVKNGWTGKVVKRAKYRHTPSAFVFGTNIRPVFLRITKPFTYRDNSDEDALFPVATAMRNKGLMTAREYVGVHDREDRDEFIVARLWNRGYDGLRYVNRGEDTGSVSWVILRPDQVWSAFSGTADPL